MKTAEDAEDGEEFLVFSIGSAFRAKACTTCILGVLCGFDWFVITHVR
jgi:hypothetical protein